MWQHKAGWWGRMEGSQKRNPAVVGCLATHSGKMDRRERSFSVLLLHCESYGRRRRDDDQFTCKAGQSIWSTTTVYFESVLIIPQTFHYSTKSSELLCPVIPKSRTVLDEHALSVVEPTSWTSLLVTVRSAHSILSFSTQLSYSTRTFQQDFEIETLNWPLSNLLICSCWVD